MDSASPESYKKHVRVYITVFTSLAVLTLVTVAVSYLELSTVPAVALALFIASIKAGLVMCYFMHLISEKKIISWILLLTAFYFLTLLIIPAISS